MSEPAHLSSSADGRRRNGGGSTWSPFSTRLSEPGSAGRPRSTGTGSDAVLAGSSTASERLRAQVLQAAATSSPVLVSGESGTGKSLVARVLHARSPRAAGPFVRLDCAFPCERFESEFLGHLRGAFPGALSDRAGRLAAAAGGTLVLEEVGSLGAKSQAALVRVLEHGEYRVLGAPEVRPADARIVATTSEDLPARVRTGYFRADLFYRLNVLAVAVPPLRHHREDLADVAEHLLSRLARARGVERAAAPLALPRGALPLLESHAWPGNVRELENLLERALAAHAAGRPWSARLFRGLLAAAPLERAPRGPDELHLRANLDSFERSLVVRALERSGGRKKEAAALLGIDPRNLAYYLRKHGIAGILQQG